MNAAGAGLAWAFDRRVDGSANGSSPGLANHGGQAAQGPASVGERRFSHDLISNAVAGPSSGSSEQRPTSSKGSKGKAKRLLNRVKRYHERSMTGCLTCRKRRVKCDETKPVCQRCACGDRECVYVDTAAASPARSRGVQPSTSRVAQADTADQTEDGQRPIGLQVSSLLQQPVEHPRPKQERNRDGEVAFRYPLQTVTRQDLYANRDRRLSGEEPHRNLTSRGSGISVTPARRGCYHDDDATESSHHSRAPSGAYDASRSDTSPLRKLVRKASFASTTHEQTFYSDHDRASPLDGAGSADAIWDLPPAFTADNLEPFFVTLEEQSLVRHFVADVAAQLCVVEVSPADNPWVRHVAAMCLTHPAGTNALADALGSALLSIAGLDLGHRIALSTSPQPSRRASASASAANSLDGRLSRGSRSSSGQVLPAASGLAASLSMTAATASQNTARSSVRSTNFMLELSDRRREESLKLLKVAVHKCDGPLSRTDAMLMLSAVLALSTRDRLAGRPDWQDGSHVVARTVAEFGGPAALVQASDPAGLFVIEQLATYEALAALTASDTLALFLQPWEPWWHRLIAATENTRRDSIVQTCGIPHGLIDLIARLSRVEETRQELQLRCGRTITVSDTPGASSPAAALPPEYERSRAWLDATAHGLATEIAAWTSSSAATRTPSGLSATMPSDSAMLLCDLYAATADLYLQSVIFSRPPEHPALVRPTSAVLDCCEDLIRQDHLYGLVLPICFAALSVHQLGRDRIRTMLFDLHRPCHFDLDKVSERFELLWRQVDARVSPPDLGMLADVACFNWSR